MKIFIADHQARVRYALSTLLQKHHGWYVSGAVKDAEDLLCELSTQDTDALLLDWSLPGIQHEQLIESIHNSHPALRIIIMSANPEIKFQAKSLGADFFINKTEPPERMITTLQACERELTEENEFYLPNQFGTLI